VRQVGQLGEHSGNFIYNNRVGQSSRAGDVITVACDS
jgi:hypothetical protein